MGRWFRNRAGEEKGAMLVLLSVAMTVMIGATALAVDVGRVTNNNRSLQAVADVIAMDAGRQLGPSAAQLSSTHTLTDAVQASATRNGVALTKLTVDVGTLIPTFQKTESALINGVVQTMTSTSAPTAVRVTASDTVNFAFSRGGKASNRNAVATQTAVAGLSVGSFLARVNTSTGLLNSMLGGMLGANLTLVGYTGIAAGTVSLGELQTQLGIGTLDALLTTSVSAKSLLNAIAAALNAKGDLVSVTARCGSNTVTCAQGVLAMATATSPAKTLKLGDLISIPQGGGSAAAAVSLNVLQLIQMAAQVANGTNALSLTLGASALGGLASLLNPAGNALSLKVIEAPKMVIGPATKDAGGNWLTTVRTAQVRLMIDLKPLGLLNLPIYVEAASATASLTGITCATPVNNSTVKVHTDTQAVRVRLGTINDISAATPTLTAANLLNVTALGIPIARVSASADVPVSSSPADLIFQGPFNWSNTETVGTSSLGLGSLLQGDIDLDLIILGGLELGLGGVLGSVTGLLTPILSILDSVLLDPLLSGLGISLGGGDVTNFSLDCDSLKLVS